MKTDATRKQIAQVLGSDVRFTLHKVGFSDLARASAYELRVRDVPNGIVSRQTYEQYREVYEDMQRVREQYTYRGLPIL